MRVWLLLCVLLAGCVTVTIYNSLDEMRAEAPQTTLSSAKSPTQLAECIARNAERPDRGFIPSIKGGEKPGSIELIIRTVTYGTLMGMADLQPSNPGSGGIRHTMDASRHAHPDAGSVDERLLRNDDPSRCDKPANESL